MRLKSRLQSQLHAALPAIDLAIAPVAVTGQKLPRAQLHAVFLGLWFGHGQCGIQGIAQLRLHRCGIGTIAWWTGSGSSSLA